MPGESKIALHEHCPDELKTIYLLQFLLSCCKGSEVRLGSSLIRSAKGHHPWSYAVLIVFGNAVFNVLAEAE